MKALLSVLLVLAAVAQTARAEDMRTGALNQTQVDMLSMIASYAQSCPNIFGEKIWLLNIQCVYLVKATMTALSVFLPPDRSRHVNNILDELRDCEIKFKKRLHMDPACVDDRVKRVQFSLSRLRRELPPADTIRVPSGDPLKPLRVVSECPAGQETIVIDYPNPGDKTCVGEAPAPRQPEPNAPTPTQDAP